MVELGVLGRTLSSFTDLQGLSNKYLYYKGKKKKNPSYVTVVSIFTIYPTVKKILNEKPYRYIYL